MSALSVSISAITSPRFTGSPTRLRQAISRPSSIVSESLGMRICLGIAVLPVLRLERDLEHGLDDSLRVRKRELFEVRGVRSRNVGCGHALHRRFELVE